MLLLVPLTVTTLAVWGLANWLVRRGWSALAAWSTWNAAAGAGMAAVYVCTAITHFIEPQRSGLVAIVPTLVPFPALAVTVTGIVELVLAAALATPRLRRWAAAASILLLLALLPANVVAAGGVDHPAAPDTPLVLRALLQLIFVLFSVAALLRDRATPRV